MSQDIFVSVLIPAKNEANNLKPLLEEIRVALAAESYEIIVVDLSKVKESTSLDIGQLHAKDILNKCICDVAENHMADVPPVLDKFFPEGDWPTVHVYNTRGTPADAPAYEARFSQIMATGLAGWGR